MFLPPPADPTPPPRPAADQQDDYGGDEVGYGRSEARRRGRRRGRGRSEEQASEAVQLEADHRKVLKEAGEKNIVIGGFVCVLGLAITIGTLAAASGPGGGGYVIAWGAIVFGAVQFFRGLSQVSQARQP